MTSSPSPACTAFRGHQVIARGTPERLVRELHKAREGILVFDDTTGRVVDLDWRLAQIAEEPGETPPPPRRRGRPRLGVTAREVTLLPRHWDWLALQPGGASQALRRLVEEARRADGGRTARRQAQERCYRVLSALGGDLPGFEEASRQLFAQDMAAFAQSLAAWPPDLRDYILGLSRPDSEPSA
ncbi:DUF2239 family protein [Novosphingobium profundi]|uniref:DUF2239 family protein n=1 Tax=Novosphingobium profundi TaxID=1774954 RepID=UPI001BD9E53A|nr:DUF2239 family protein [Novosphingobium profundi]MBT0670313.1 DUF2239 family protein [Novosphingobium profundi]